METKKLLLRQASEVDDMTFERFICPPDFDSPDKFATYGHQINIYEVFKNYLAYNPTAKAITAYYETSIFPTTTILRAISGRSYYVGQQVSGTMVFIEITPVSDYTLTWTVGSTKRFIIVKDIATTCEIIFEYEATWLYFGNKVTNVKRNAANSRMRHIHCTQASKITVFNGNFQTCAVLNTTVYIPTSITSIGSNTFANCGQLTGILNIPYSVSSIGTGAFSSFTSIILNNNYFYTDGISLYNASKTALKYVCNGQTGIFYTKPECTSTETNCGCGSYTGIVFNEGLTTINNGSFAYNQVTSIDLSSTVSNISISSFMSSPITTVIARRLTPTTNSGIDLARRQAGTLHVYASALAAYQAHANWGQFGTILGDL